MKTALKQFLVVLENETHEYYDIINNEGKYFSDDVYAAKMAVTDLVKLLEKGNEFLEKEKLQIMDAYNDGILESENSSFPKETPESYFKKNYNND